MEAIGLTYVLRKMKTNLFRTVKGCKIVSYDNELGMFTQEKSKRAQSWPSTLLKAFVWSAAT